MTYLKITLVIFLSIAIPGIIIIHPISAETFSKPPIPYENNGACPFECCTYREWYAKKETIILKDRRNGSPVAYKVGKGERVTGLTGVVITTKPGRVKVLKPVRIGYYNASRGEIVYLLTYRGEGFFKVWYKGNIIDSVDMYGLDTNKVVFSILESPESIWWVQIKNKDGQTGWSNKPEDFDNKDACG